MICIHSYRDTTDRTIGPHVMDFIGVIKIAAISQELNVLRANYHYENSLGIEAFNVKVKS